MKTTILTAAVIFLMTSATVWASDDTNSVYRNDDAKKMEAFIKVQPSNIIEFRVVNPDHEKVTFKIYADKNNKIYERTLKSDDGIRIGCDMTDFNRGTYVCVIEKNGQEVDRKAITLK